MKFCSSDYGWMTAGTLLVILVNIALWWLCGKVNSSKPAMAKMKIDAATQTDEIVYEKTFRLNYLTVDQLKVLCRAHNIPMTGLKSNLIERLIIASNQ